MIASVIGESMSKGIGGMIQMGKPQYLLKTLSHCNFFSPWIPIGLPWDWTRAYTVINHLNHEMGPVQEISTSDFCWNVCETSVPHVFKGINNNIQVTSWPFSNIPLKCCLCEHLN